MRSLFPTRLLAAALGVLLLSMGETMLPAVSGAQPVAGHRIPTRKEAPPLMGVDDGADLATFDFPWPPPKATARYELPANLLAQSDSSTVGAAALAVRRAMDRAGVEQWAVFTLGGRGFAYLTRLERTDKDGVPLKGRDRWPEELRSDVRQHGVMDYFKSLFVSEPGYYRVIAIVVTSARVADTGTPMPADSAAVLLHQPQHLPESLLAKRLPGLHATALIYQYKSVTRDATPKLLAQTSVPPAEQLASSGFWKLSELKAH